MPLVEAVEAEAQERDKGRVKRQRDIAAIVAMERPAGMYRPDELFKLARAGVNAAVPDVNDSEKEALTAVLVEKALRIHGTRDRAGIEGLPWQARREATRRYPSPQDRGRRVVAYLACLENPGAEIPGAIMERPPELAISRARIGRNWFQAAAWRVAGSSRAWRDTAEAADGWKDPEAGWKDPDGWKREAREQERGEAAARVQSLEAMGAYGEAAEAQEAMSAGRFSAVDPPLPVHGKAVGDITAVSLMKEGEATATQATAVSAIVQLALSPHAGAGAKIARETGLTGRTFAKRCASGREWVRENYPPETDPDGREILPFLARIARAVAQSDLERDSDSESIDSGLLRAAASSDPGIRLTLSLIYRERPYRSAELGSAEEWITAAQNRAKLERDRGSVVPMSVSPGPRGRPGYVTRSFSRPASLSPEALAEGRGNLPAGLHSCPPELEPDGLTAGMPTYSQGWAKRVDGWRANRDRADSERSPVS